MQQFNSRRVRAARILAGLSREEVAERVGVNVSAIATWERHQLPQSRFLPLLADALGVRVGDLFDDVEVSA